MGNSSTFRIFTSDESWRGRVLNVMFLKNFVLLLSIVLLTALMATMSLIIYKLYENSKGFLVPHGGVSQVLKLIVIH